jgi:prepilin-type N-terminal cleavage/methylation domain-containing protein
MKTALHRGFTLIELLVVIAIIAILASLLMPSLARIKTVEKINRAKREMAAISTGISKYESEYGRFPVSATAINRATPGRDDYTYGGSVLNLALGPGSWISDNNEVMAVLLDLEKYADGTATINQGHVKNPRGERYLEAASVSLGADGVCRDPWGTPYVISIDLNNDNNCRDAFYRLQSVSQSAGATGFYGLSNPVDANGAGDHFEHHATIMIWSAGPDKAIDKNQKANAGVNKDNVLSWR